MNFKNHVFASINLIIIHRKQKHKYCMGISSNNWKRGKACWGSSSDSPSLGILEEIKCTLKAALNIWSDGWDPLLLMWLNGDGCCDDPFCYTTKPETTLLMGLAVRAASASLGPRLTPFIFARSNGFPSISNDGQFIQYFSPKQKKKTFFAWRPLVLLTRSIEGKTLNFPLFLNSPCNSFHEKVLGTFRTLFKFERFVP